MTSNDSGRCRMHGGASLRGIAHPRYVDGRHSKVLPARLAGRYQAALADPELLNLRAEIALVDARVEELLGSLDAGESGRLWSDMKAQRATLLSAQRVGRQDEAAAALKSILALIENGAADVERWAEIADFLERRRRLVESEQKRLVAMQQMVTAEQAMTLVAALAASVRAHVLERVDADVGRAILARVQEDLTRLVADSARAGTD